MAYLKASMPTFFTQDYQVSTNEMVKWFGGDYFLIFQPGAFPLVGPVPAPQNHLIKDYAWTMKANLYVRFAEYGTAWQNYKDVRAALIFWMGSNPALHFNQTTYVKNAQSSALDSMSDPVYWQKNKSQPAPNFINQILRFIVVQRITFALNIS